MGLAGLDVGDDGLLVIVPAGGDDPRLRPHPGVPAIGPNQEAGAEAPTIAQGEPGPVRISAPSRGVRQSQRRPPGRAEQGYVRRRLQVLPEGELGDAVLDDMPQIRLPQISAVEVDTGATDGVPDPHLAVRADTQLRHALPDAGPTRRAETFQQPLAGATEGGDAQIDLPGRPVVPGLPGLGYRDAQPPARAGRG